jgi:bifunctional oligoribonuclease and PAP phosphatase NrnA
VNIYIFEALTNLNFKMINNWFTHDLSELKDKLNHTDAKILIITHRNPDGDAIGSITGLYRVLKKIGYEVNMIVPNDFPSFLKWIPEAKKIQVFSKENENVINLLKTANIVFALDFNDLSRVQEFQEHVSGSSSYKVIIDHHPEPGKIADLIISNTSLSSTAEMVYVFLTTLGHKHLIDKETATSLYAGIMTDTGGFSFNSSRPETFQVVSDLLNYGIEKDNIYDKIYDNFSFNRMRLMGYALNNKMQFFPHYRTALISLTADELKKYDFKIGDSEGFVNLPLSIKGVIFSALFIENKDRIKISFRSKGSFAVNKLCADHFNGGGHKNASGGESFDTLQNTIDKFIKLLPDYSDELNKD